VEPREASLKDWPRLEGLIVGGRLILDRGLQGGQGVYFTASDAADTAVVGCKVLNPSYAAGEDSLHRFQEEGRLLMEFQHDNVVKGLDAGHQGGLHYIIMRHLEGDTLSGRMQRDGLLPEKDVCRLMEGIASALAYFHERGYVHRDIKPSNVVWCRDGVARIIDLGTFWDEMDPNPREKDLIMGTVQYMSPEQAAGDNARIDHRSDCYSLGMTVLHLMSGHPPFPDKDPNVILTKQVTDDPVIDQEVTRRFSPGAIFIVRKMIEKRPDMRYQTPDELLDDIRRMDEDRTQTWSALDATVVQGRQFFEIETQAAERRAAPGESARMAEAVLRAVSAGDYRAHGLAAGEVVFYEGDTDDDVYVLREGEVEILQGGRLLARSSEPGFLFGEMAALLGEPRSGTIRARTASSLIVLTRGAYLQLLEQNPDLALTTARVIGERLSRTNVRLVDAMSRLARLEKHVRRLFARSHVQAFSADQFRLIQTQLLELLRR
jgi:CRP-like cAMP-binding protein